MEPQGKLCSLQVLLVPRKSFWFSQAHTRVLSQCGSGVFGRSPEKGRKRVWRICIAFHESHIWEVDLPDFNSQICLLSTMQTYACTNLFNFLWTLFSPPYIELMTYITLGFWDAEELSVLTYSSTWSSIHRSWCHHYLLVIWIACSLNVLRNHSISEMRSIKEKHTL